MRSRSSSPALLVPRAVPRALLQALFLMTSLGVAPGPSASRSFAEDAPAPASEAAPVPPAAEPAPVDALLSALERLQGDPASLAAAREAVAKKIEELRAGGTAAGAEAETSATARAAAEAKLAELRAALDETAKKLEALKSEVASLEAEPPKLAAAAEAALARQADLARKVELLERSLALLEPPPAPDAEKEMAEGAPAPAPAADPAAAPAITPEIEEFFEKKIRPVLVASCYECHGPDKQKSELRVDSREAILKGGIEGPGIVPGDPDKSLFIQSIRYDGDFLMPPSGKLPDDAIADLTAWVKMGAPWPAPPAAPPAESAPVGDAPAPAEGAAPAAGAPAESAAAAAPSPAGHWAFQPVADPAPPEVALADRVRSPIDRFVFAKLEAAGLEPAPEADRRTLARRVSIDLTGLPPTREEIEAFERDEAPDAYERLVDRMLASPRYGERWGRHWLDVARYADTKGYVFQEERRYPHSYTYRDYVIRAFNEDRPYDRFVMEQIAADRMDLGEEKWPLAAMGFLTLGRRFLNNPHDIADDRIDVITRGLQGLTVSCSRCHDHKYDPIPQADYYSLHGIFMSSTEPSELPLIGEPAPSPEYDEFLRRRTELQAEVDAYFRARHAEFLTRERRKAAEYLKAAGECALLKTDDEIMRLASERGLSHYVIRRWMDFLKKTAEGHDRVFGPWHEFAAVPPEIFAQAAEGLRAKAAAGGEGEKKVNGAIARAFSDETPIASMNDVWERYRRAIEETDRAWADAIQTHWQLVGIVGAEAAGPAPTALEDAGLEELRAKIHGPEGPTAIPVGMVEQLMTLEEQGQLRNRRLAVAGHDATHPGRPPRAHVLVDKEKPADSAIFLRGNPGNRGEVVPRRYLEVIEGPDRKPFADGSGRLELARAIASRDNPLTARVMVNRVWMHHFGEPIVRTPGDFGLRSEPPTHPELLDWLSTRFMESGWSVKALHRMVMHSATYRQASRHDAIAAEKDPENRLLWTFNRRRLDYESLRDSMLRVAGVLDEKMGGPAVDVVENVETARRTIYGFIDRQNLPGVMRTFDLASPDSTSARRFETTVPQQALHMMNSRFALLQAKETAKRAGEGADSPAAVVERLFDRVLSRAPSPEEIELGVRFLSESEAAGPSVEIGPWRYGYGRLNLETGRVEEFNPLPKFFKGVWQGGRKLPDEKLGWVSVGRAGGHPGSDLAHCAIRRWIAPRAGRVEITGAVRHSSPEGDGIGAHVISDRKGRIVTWAVQNGDANWPLQVEVEAGEALDFVVDSRGNEGYDSFEWAPAIAMLEERGDAASVGDRPVRWDAKEEFAGPPPEPLSPLEQLAQTLLMSNEFAFVD